MAGVVTGSWERRRVVVTGATGFKGSWLCLWLEHLGASVLGLSLPPESDASAWSAFEPWEAIESRTLDITERGAAAAAIAEFEPEVVFHLAAQALVREGYRDPVGTYLTNVIGTIEVLAGVRACSTVRVAVVVTSDKVYRNTGSGRPFTEADELGGADPYSNSKSCAELVTAAWRASFGRPDLTICTARAGNVIGGGDVSSDRLLPDVQRAVCAERAVQLRYPESTRPWQHVLDPLSGYLIMAEAAIAGRPLPDALNFGPRPADARPVRAIVEALFQLWGDGAWVPQPGPHPEEAKTLMLDASLAAETLGWKPTVDLETALAWTVDWWRAQQRGEDLRRLSLAQIRRFGQLR